MKNLIINVLFKGSSFFISIYDSIEIQIIKIIHFRKEILLTYFKFSLSLIVR